MKKINKILILIGILMVSGVLFTACQDNKAQDSQNNPDEKHSEETHSEETHSEGASETHDHAGENLHDIKASLEHNEVLITEKQMKTVDIELGKISQQQLSQLVKAFGEIALSPSGKATVSAVIGGTIRDIDVMEGDYVKKGQVIAKIEHPDIVEMQKDYLEALNRDEYLETEFERQERLSEDSVNAAKTYQKAKSEYESNLSQLQSLKQKLQLIHINPASLSPQSIQNEYPVLAPISGYVAEVDINTGIHVTPQQSLFHITANDQAHIDLKVYEKDIGKIAVGQPLTFNLANNPVGQPLQGEIMKMAKRFDSDQRTALVHAKISEMNENLLPGLSVIAHIQTGGKEYKTLPEAAFVSDQGKDYLFVVNKRGTTQGAHQTEGEEKHREAHEGDHNKSAHEHQIDYYIFQRVEVDKDLSEAGFSGFQLKEDVSQDARFVVNNAQALMSEMKNSGDDHGHAH
ncbi:MAG: efflux RND transporter periplasmic adaptor subunit [Bacteroidota bacterium]